MLTAISSVLRKEREKKLSSGIVAIAAYLMGLDCPYEVAEEYATQQVLRTLTGRSIERGPIAIHSAWVAVHTGNLPGGEAGVSVAPIELGERDIPATETREDRDELDLADYFPFVGTCRRTGLAGCVSFGHSPIH